jgi:hypothetical protein
MPKHSLPPVRLTPDATLLAALVLAWCGAACSTPPDDAPPVATPSVTLSRSEAPVGSPIDVTYKFVVAADAPAFAEDYIVFVHFLTTDGTLMWTDDHLPPTPTRQWKPGATVEYTRTIFVEKFPYVGEARVQMGLYSRASNVRLPLGGENAGGRSYRVAAFQMTLQTNNLFVVFKEGWHDTELADDGRVEWQWLKKQGTLSFRNPRRDVEVMLLADMPEQAFAEPQRVEVRLGTSVVDTFALPGGERELRRIRLTASQLGDRESVDVTVSVDKTFVPAGVPQLKNSDPRELGIRVFRVHIEPK